MKLDKRVRTIWLLRNMVFIIVLLVVLGVVLFNNPNDLLVYGLALGIPFLVIIILLLIWPFLAYKNYEYSYDDERIIINHGVIFRHRVLVPICQIQDLHTYQGPFMMILHISGLIISTAGSNHTIAGIKSEDSQVLVSKFEELLNKRLEAKAND